MTRFVRALGRLLPQGLHLRRGYDAGLRAYNRRDYARALRIWRRLAKRGHAEAQCKLGIMYHNGDGVPQDIAVAMTWYRRAAAQGNEEAQFCLRLRDQQTTPRTDPPRERIRQQDIHRLPTAARPPEDTASRVRQRGPTLVRREPSIAPQPPPATPQHPDGAAPAADRDEPRIVGRELKVRRLRLSHETQRKRLDAAQDAYDRGDYAAALRDWKPLARQGNSEAQNSLGILFDHGLGVPKDAEEAVLWYRRAAEQGHAKAQTNLGVMYCTGDGVEFDINEALRWTRAGAEQGMPKAQYNLGLMYVNGSGVEVDYVEAHMWLALAAAQNNPDAVKGLDLLSEQMSEADIAKAEARRREREIASTRDMVQRLTKY